MPPSPPSRPEPDADALVVSTFFDVSLDLLVIRELDGRVVRASPSWETVLGWRPDELEGLPLLRLLHPDDQLTTLESVVEVENRGPRDPMVDFKNRYRHKDGAYRTLEWRARRVGDRVYGMARDVTDRVAAERELMEAKAAAEVANQAEPGELPRAVLVQDPGDQASAAEVEAGEREVTVDPGHGAFVLSGGWHDPEVGEPFVMDAKGFSYALIGTDAVDNLGFGDYDAPVVPDSWLHLFEQGEELSVDAALCPPVRPSRDDRPEGGGEESDQGDGQGESCE